VANGRNFRNVVELISISEPVLSRGHIEGQCVDPTCTQRGMFSQSIRQGSQSAGAGAAVSYKAQPQWWKSETRPADICRVTDNLRDTIALVAKIVETSPCTPRTPRRVIWPEPARTEPNPGYLPRLTSRAASSVLRALGLAQYVEGKPWLRHELQPAAFLSAQGPRSRSRGCLGSAASRNERVRRRQSCHSA
jgi:hypothetical protein